MLFYLLYGCPDAFGALDLPTNPTNANNVNTYGIIVKNCCGIGNLPALAMFANASPNANSKLAAIAPSGFHLPKS